MSITRKSVSIIGDSTLDNKIWVDKGFSVVQHLAQQLADFQIYDLSNDGFTSKDCLEGAWRDKAVTGKLFPHVKFSPLIEGAKEIKQSDFIVLSVGGNDFREFLARVFSESNKPEFIKKHFSNIILNMQKNYLTIIEHLFQLNSKATIILLTQYYPSRHQNNYQIYEFMDILRQSLGMGKECKDADTMIKHLMYLTFAPIFKKLQASQYSIIAADATSSLDPYDKSNHVCQIEPSVEGGRKIAKMLANLILNQVAHGRVYQFTPAFFIEGQSSHNSVQSSTLLEWMPCHPNEIRMQKQRSSSAVLVARLGGGCPANSLIENKDEPCMPIVLAKHTSYFAKNNIHITPKLMTKDVIQKDIQAYAPDLEKSEAHIYFYQMVMSYAVEVQDLSYKKCYELFAKINFPTDKWSTFLDLLKESRDAYRNNQDVSLLSQFVESINQGKLTKNMQDRLYPEMQSKSKCLVM